MAAATPIDIGDRIIAWDVGFHDMSICCMEVGKYSDAGVNKPVIHILDWRIINLVHRTNASLAEVVDALVDFWYCEMDLLNSAQHHIIEIQFRNPKMRALSHCIQTLVLAKSAKGASVKFMGSNTKFPMATAAGVPMVPQIKGGGLKRQRLVTKQNSVTLAHWLLESSPRCGCERCLKRKELWGPVLAGASRGQLDDYCDSLGLGWAAVTKYLSLK